MLTAALVKAEDARTSLAFLVMAQDTTGLRTGPSLRGEEDAGRWYVVTVRDCIFLYSNPGSYTQLNPERAS